MIGIYLITNKVNGNKYVGQSKNVEKRIAKHLKSSSNKRIEIDKEIYGIESFEYSILETCLESELADREEHYFNLLNPEYNIRRKYDRVSITEQTRKKMRGSALKRMEDKEARKETMLNLSKGVKFKSRRVAAILTIDGSVVEYESLFSAQESTGVPRSSIHQILNGKRKQSKGFVFEYLN